MKKSSLRSFGIACFIIGALFSINEKFNLGILKTESKETTINYEEKITQLEKELTEANKQIALLEENQTILSDEKSSVADTNEETVLNTPITEDEQSSEEIISGTLYIYSGLTPYEVGQKLEDLGIVENAVEMELFLAKPEYSRSIQKGQYELNSSMSIKEIANIITGK